MAKGSLQGEADGQTGGADDRGEACRRHAEHAEGGDEDKRDQAVMNEA